MQHTPIFLLIHALLFLLLLLHPPGSARPLLLHSRSASVACATVCSRTWATCSSSSLGSAPASFTIFLRVARDMVPCKEASAGEGAWQRQQSAAAPSAAAELLLATAAPAADVIPEINDSGDGAARPAAPLAALPHGDAAESFKRLVRYSEIHTDVICHRVRDLGARRPPFGRPQVSCDFPAPGTPAAATAATRPTSRKEDEACGRDGLDGL